MLEESSTDTLNFPKHRQLGPRLEHVKPETSLEAKMKKLKLSYFRCIMSRQGSAEKTVSLWREGRKNRKTDCEMD